MKVVAKANSSQLSWKNVDNSPHSTEIHQLSDRKIDIEELDTKCPVKLSADVETNGGVHKAESSNNSMEHNTTESKCVVDSDKSSDLVCVCILCANQDSYLRNKPVTKYAQLIRELSGIDVFEMTDAPTACPDCIKQLQKIDNFKKQIIYTRNLIKTPYFSYNKVIDTKAIKRPFNAYVDAATSTEDDSKTEVTTKLSESDTNGWWFKYHETDKNTSMGTSINSQHRTNRLQTKIGNQKVNKTPVVKDKAMCAKCGYLFPTLKRLHTHNSVAHKEKRHLCELCGSLYKGATQLHRHVLSIHTSEKQFACSYCSRKFSLKDTLTNHLLLHTNTFPHKCPMCEKAFRHNVTLKQHIAKCHSASECAVVYDRYGVGEEQNSNEENCDYAAAIPASYIKKRKSK